MSKIICIGRQYGSGGREIGEKLARTLQIPCYDKLLIKKAAFESGMSEEFISKTEESPINSIQFLSGNPYADMAGIGNAFYSESQLAYDAEKRVIEEIGKKGDCIIIGRCASAILPKDEVLSVFIYADHEDRVRRVMNRNRLDERAAFNPPVNDAQSETKKDNNQTHKGYGCAKNDRYGKQVMYHTCVLIVVDVAVHL